LRDDVGRRSLYAEVAVEASKLKTLYDLAASPDEDVELVGGEIVRRPMTRRRRRTRMSSWSAGRSCGGR